MRRSGLTRSGALEEAVGDPLDGLVNLFDVGLVLAVAFLVAGLTLAVDAETGAIEPPTEAQPREEQRERTLPSQAYAAPARGRGEAVGRVYRLDDGRLIYVEGEE